MYVQLFYFSRGFHCDYPSSWDKYILTRFITQHVSGVFNAVIQNKKKHEPNSNRDKRAQREKRKIDLLWFRLVWHVQLICHNILLFLPFLRAHISLPAKVSRCRTIHWWGWFNSRNDDTLYRCIREFPGDKQISSKLKCKTFTMEEEKWRRRTFSAGKVER